MDLLGLSEFYGGRSLVVYTYIIVYNGATVRIVDFVVLRMRVFTPPVVH